MRIYTFEQIRDMGWDAARNGCCSDYNPYDIGTVPYSCWLAGWESFHFGR